MKLYWEYTFPLSFSVPPSAFLLRSSQERGTGLVFALRRSLGMAHEEAQKTFLSLRSICKPDKVGMFP